MIKGLSSRFHLALGLSSLVVSVLLLALNLGLVPDREAAVRAGRQSLAEAVAASSTTLMSDEDDTRLRRLLAFIAQRNPELLSIGIRRADGALALQVGDHEHGWVMPAHHLSTDTQLLLPILEDGRPAGRIELHFAPLRASGFASAWLSPAGLLIGGSGAVCFVLFYLYLRRMLRHLDPQSSIPGRVRTAFDTLAEGLLVLDPNGRIVLANRAFTQLSGGEAQALIGQRAASLPWTNQSRARIHNDDTPWVASLDDAQARHNVLMYLDDAEGVRRTFMVNCSPVPGAHGKPAGVLVSFDDVTELEEKEIELRVARDEAEAANRAKSDFLANMSHEIRTPMNAILGFTELLRRGVQHDAKDARKYLDIIHGSGKHLLELINDILDLSKVEAGLLEVERIRSEAHRVVHDVVRVLKVKADEKGVGLTLEFAEALPATVLIDPSRLRQIVTNLVGNALKFTQQGSVTLTMHLDRTVQPPQLLIDIADTGIGIPADKLDAIFEPFVQAEASTTRQFGGTGLGLAISRRFARALGGDVTVSSRPGQGSTFRVSLEIGPLDGVEWLSPQALAAAQDATQATETASWRFPAARVLVVDDGAENRELVRLVLESAGLTVLEAEHGAAALEVVAGRPVDLVLMDVQMPVMDGYTATRTLRERGHTLPVLALTANAMKGFEQQIQAAGFSGHLTKPVDIDAMLAELAQRLGGQKVEAVAVAEPPAATAPTLALARVDLPLDVSLDEPLDEPALPPIESRLAQHPRLRKVARNFALQLPAKLQAMQEAAAGGDLATLAQLAHWLKGAGGTVGFDAFFEPARDLEQHAMHADLGAVDTSLRLLQAMAARVVVPEDAAAAPAPATAPTSADAKAVAA